MPWISQMLGFALLFIGIAVAVYLSIWILLVVFAIGIVVVAWAHLKAFLLRKGILNPTPGVRRDFGEQQQGLPPVIDADYKRVDSE